MVLLLLLAQLGAVVHEIGHLCRVGTSIHVQLHADTSADNKTCELCLAYSQMGSPLAGQHSVTLLEPDCPDVDAHPPWAVTPSETLSPRSRGPPAAQA